MKKTKNNKILIEKIDTSKIYDPIEAIKILKENSYTKFEESVEVAINLGIDSMSILLLSQKKTIESMYFMSLFSFAIFSISSEKVLLL